MAARFARNPLVLITLLLITAAGCSEITGPPVAAERDTLTIARENERMGTRDWYGANLAAQSDLAIWASPYSAAPGDTLDIYLHAQTGSVSIALYRLGWYGGTGGHLLNRISVTGHPQPPCTTPFPGPVVCPWSVAERVVVSDSMLSGVYLLKAVNDLGAAALYPFVIRSRSKSEFVAVVPQLTWQAYNEYGGSSLYTAGPDGHLGHLVSFDRPYALRGGASYIYGVGASNDMSVLLWLEREGYDVSYVSDADLPALATSELAPRKALLFIGHDEYWTMEEFVAVRQLRDLGMHLAFLSGNDAYWRVRLSPSPVTGRTDIIACYKSDFDPLAVTSAARTTLFRSLGMPENALVGTGYMQHSYGGPYPLIAADSNLGAEGRAFLAAADLAPGDSIPAVLNMHTPGWPKFGALEGNQVLNNGQTPGNIQVVFRAPYTGGVVTRNGVFESTFYRAGSGTGVFSTGMNEWGSYLSGFYQPEDGRISAFTRSVMQWMRSH